MAKTKVTKKSGKAGETAAKIGAVVIAIILAVYVVVSLVVASWNPAQWVKIRKSLTNDSAVTLPDPDGDPSTDNPPVDNEVSGSNMIATPSSSELVRLSVASLMETGNDGIATIAEDGFVLTASNDSGDSSLDEYVWSAAFENASSSWASGKAVSDYLNISTSSDTKQQTIRAKQAYGEPIIVTVASKFNADATATCKFDYVKRISSVTLKVNDTDYLILGAENSYNLTSSYGVGTVTGELTVNTVTVNLGGQVADDVTYALGPDYGDRFKIVSVTIGANDTFTPFDFITTSYGGNGGGGATEVRNSNTGKLAYNAVLDDSSISYGNLERFYLSVNATYSYNYNGSVYQTGETPVKHVPYSNGNLTKYSVVSNVNLNYNHVVL